MNKILKEKLINHIKEKYKNNQNIDLEDKIDLESKLSSNFDPALEEYKKDIYATIKKRINTNGVRISKSITDKDVLPDIENLEEIEDLADEEPATFDLEIIEKIDNKVLSILQYLNMDIYNKNDLKETIINDMLEYIFFVSVENGTIDNIINKNPERISQERFIQELKKIVSPELKIFFSKCYKTDEKDKENRYLIRDLTKQEKLKLRGIFNSILWYIEKHIDYEFNEHEKRKVQIKKELWENLLRKILPEIDGRLEEHKKKRLKNVNKIQIKQFRLSNKIFELFLDFC